MRRSLRTGARGMSGDVRHDPRDLDRLRVSASACPISLDYHGPPAPSLENAMLFGLIALIIAALFAGAAAYIALAEHPARMQLPTGPMLMQWKPSYARGFAMQATLAVVGGVAGAAAWWITRESFFLVGALLLIANWPYTLLVIMPVNHRLNATDPDQTDDVTRRDLIRWGQLHAVRTVLGCASTLAFARALLYL